MRTFLTILALWAAGLGAGAQFGKLAADFAALEAVYAAAGGAVGLAVSLISLFGLVFGLVAGEIVARVGPRRVILVCLVLGAALSAMQAALPAFPLFLTTRIAEGVSHLGLVVALPTLIAGLAPDRWRAPAMTLWSTFFGVAFASLAWVGPGVVAAGGLGTLFALHGAYLASMALLLWALVPPTPGAPRAADPGAGLLARHAALYRSPWLAAPAWGWIFYTLTFVAALTLLPRLMGPDMPRWLPSALPLASILSTMILGFAILRRVPAVPVAIGAFALSAILSLVLAATGGVVPALALFAALGLVQASSFAAVPELNPAPVARAMANGAVAQAGNLGNLVGTPILLALVTGASPAAAFLAIALAYATGAVLHLACARARARAQAVSASRAT